MNKDVVKGIAIGFIAFVLAAMLALIWLREANLDSRVSAMEKLWAQVIQNGQRVQQASLMPSVSKLSVAPTSTLTPVK